MKILPLGNDVETVVLLGWKDVDEYIYIDYQPDHHQKKRGRATYQQIKEKCGFEKRDNYNKGKEGHRVPICTPEKEQAISLR